MPQVPGHLQLQLLPKGERLQCCGAHLAGLIWCSPRCVVEWPWRTSLAVAQLSGAGAAHSPTQLFLRGPPNPGWVPCAACFA